MRVILSFLTGALLLFPLPMHGEEGEEVMSSDPSVSSPEEEVMPLAVPAEELPSEACVSGEVSIVTEGGGNGANFADLRADFSEGYSEENCLWDFGDGWREEVCNPLPHTYESAASYQVILEITNHCGNTMIQTLVVDIGDDFDEGGEDGNDGKDGNETDGECGSVLSGISVSEFLPNPTGDEAKEEWIELRNDNAFPVTLCGWQIDDGDGGSKPFSLDGFLIPAQSYQILTRPMSGIALNNDRDSVRLYAPLAPGSSEKILVQTVPYENAPDGSSYASADGGMSFVWSAAPTPNAATIPPKPRVFSHNIVIASALPNPKGTDAGYEWIELYSPENEQIDLSDYVLTRGSQRGIFGPDTVLPPRQVTRFMTADLKLTLPNTDGELALYDPAGMFIASLAWDSASDGMPVRHTMPQSSRISARIVSVLDGKTVELMLLNPPKELAMHGVLVAELLGIDVPSLTSTNANTVSNAERAQDFLRALIQGKEVELEFDTKTWTEEGRLLAYFSVVDGMDVQEEMLKNGIVEAWEKDDYARHSLFVSLQQEAENQNVGLWTSPSSSSESDDDHDESDEEETSTDSEEEEDDNTTSITKPESSYDDFSSYGRAEVLITEIYPRPKKGTEEEEWIEIHNIGASPAHLSGFTIEDVTTSKSRFFVFPQGFVVQEGEYVVLQKTLTKLSLNDGGQEIVLRDAEDMERQRISYPSIKEGVSYMLGGDIWCLSSSPSPGVVNTCGASGSSAITAVAASVGTSSKKPQQSGLSLLKTKFRNIVSGSDESSTGAVQDSFSGVFAGMTMADQSPDVVSEKKINGFPKRYLLIAAIAIIGGVLSLYGSRFPLGKEKY